MNQLSLYIKAILNSYSILFFSQNRILGLILLMVSFFYPVSGFAGLGCVLFSLLVGRLLEFGFDDLLMSKYSFNSLLLGIAFGTFYHVNLMFILWLTVTCCMVIVASVVISQSFEKLDLPMLSVPFIVVFWIVILTSNSVFNMGLQQKNSYLLEGIYSGQGNFAGVEGYLLLKLPQYVSLFFRSLSAVLFQHCIITGMLISLGMLIHSRIAFSLLVIGFIAACGLNTITHTYPDGISYYHLGANFMMTAVAMGSFFTIPSLRSYILAIISVPMMFILISAFSNFLWVYRLPVFSLPFCILNISLLCFLMMQKQTGKLQLAVLQHYSPERNLYQFLNQQKRLNDLIYIQLNLPFMGFWSVSQGYNGAITHKGEWGQALDFVISDDEQNTYQYPGTIPEHFYCYNKPVLACCDGVVELVVSYVEDNAIGKVNLKENWGNTVVLRHHTGLYSKVSHLKKNSIKVNPGDAVKKGDLLGLCGNSGRSPEPHLHFQLQATSFITAKTLSYPFACYFIRKGNTNTLKNFSIPDEGELVGNPEINGSVKKAFDLQPGYTAKLQSENGIEEWEVFKDGKGQLYIYSHTKKATAYFINNGIMFYFTSFYGDQHSLLYNFYLAAYKIMFNDTKELLVNDEFPLHLTDIKPILWLQDFIAPFYRYISLEYQSSFVDKQTGLNIVSKQFRKLGEKKIQLMEATICIDHGCIRQFNIKINHKNITAEWSTEN